jgi:hypothetical protein
MPQKKVNLNFFARDYFVQKGEVWISYHCEFCGNDFKTEYGPTTKMCPYCGSTSEFHEVENE